MKRRELKLDIERVGDRYRAKVRKAPAGKGSWAWFEPPADDEIRVKDLGRRLFESVFAGPVLTAWRASLAATRGDLLLRLRLEGDPRLLKIPWEILFDPDRGTFIALERRLVRSLDLPVKAGPLEAPVPLRILVVLSSPPDARLLDVDREWAVLDEALGDSIELRLVPPRLEEVDRALRSEEWHVFHFVGHGEADKEGGSLILEDRNRESRAVDHLRLKTFLAHPSLRLIVLNACEGARPGTSDAFSGVAQALVRNGTPAVVAMQQAISDAAAITFAKTFYGALAEHQTVGGAVWKGREALFRDHEAEWSVPVLYLSGRDAPILKPPLPPSSWPWRLIAAVTAGILLVAILGLSILSRPKPEPPSQGLISIQPPRGAEENPEDCPSPKRLDIAFVKVNRGPFEMGEKKNAYQVWITRPYCIGAYEVTQELWSRVLDKPMPPADQLHLPVQDVTFEGARQFLDRLSKMDSSGRYRFPTEAEWEYAARARSWTRYFFGDDENDLPRYGNCKGGKDGFAELAPVGQLKPNNFGLYDMYGNVAEWVSDWYGDYSDKPVSDPRGPQEGAKRIRRGGGWDSGAKACSSAARSIVQPNRSDKFTGLRIVREIR